MKKKITWVAVSELLDGAIPVDGILCPGSH